MKTESGIISQIDIPEGYNIRIGKAAWYSLCFFLNIISTILSQAVSPDYQTLSLAVFTISLLSIVLAGYYFHTFRDRVRWAVLGLTFVSCLFTIEMLLRVWTGIRSV